MRKITNVKMINIYKDIYKLKLRIKLKEKGKNGERK